MPKFTFKKVDEKIADYAQAAEAADAIADPTLAKRAKQKAEHRGDAYTRITNLEGKESRAKALVLLNRAERELSGNDAKKVASLSNVIQSGDLDKMNSGFYKALLGLDKLTRKTPDAVEFSMTKLKTAVELKCNVKTSLTLLAKTNFLRQVKDGRAIVGYAIEDREGLNGLLQIFQK